MGNKRGRTDRRQKGFAKKKKALVKALHEARYRRRDTGEDINANDTGDNGDINANDINDINANDTGDGDSVNGALRATMR